MLKRWVLCLLAVFCMLFSSNIVFADNADSSQSYDIPIDDDAPKLEFDHGNVDTDGGNRDKEFGTGQDGTNGEGTDQEDTSSYSIKVRRDEFSIGGITAIVSVTANVPDGSIVVLSCYREGAISFISTERKTAILNSFVFVVHESYDTMKVMAFENFDTCRPLVTVTELHSSGESGNQFPFFTDDTIESIR